MTRRTQLHKHSYLMQRTQDQNKLVLSEEHEYNQLLESKGNLTPSITLSPCPHTSIPHSEQDTIFITFCQSRCQLRTRITAMIIASTYCILSTCQVLYTCHLISSSSIVFPILLMEKLRLKEVTCCPRSQSTLILLQSS